MLNKFFNNQDKPEEESTQYFDESKVAAVTYFVDINGKVQMDIELFDYNDESIDGLSKILEILSKDNCYMKTFEMIQDNLQTEEQDEAMIRLYDNVARQPAAEKSLKVYVDKKRERPCIRPSDML